MSEDIVTRLRAVLHNDRSVELMNHEAAEEIMQLRQQVSDLRAERDEARREVCTLKYWNFNGSIDPRGYAVLRKWDCFRAQA